MPGPDVGVVLMAYGTPRTPGDVEAYYTHIRRGRPPTDDQLADLVRRYEAIGGISPLAERTESQRAAIEREMRGAPVVLGQKHAAPFIEDALAALHERGVARVVGMVLAPHYSRASVGEYHARAQSAADEAGVDYRAIDAWHDDVAWLEFQAAAVEDGLAALPDRTVVLFTAHSLPERALVDDPYPEQLTASARAIAAAARLDDDRWALAWQSAGRTPEPWRGPDILEVIADLGTRDEIEGVLVCPQGFTSDHLEVLFDLDIEATRVAGAAGLAFARTRSVNDDPSVMAALAERIRLVAA
jgi:ferrochelatase